MPYIWRKYAIPGRNICMALPKSELVGQVRSYLLLCEDSPPPDVHFGCDMHKDRGIDDLRADLFLEQEFYVGSNRVYDDKFVVSQFKKNGSDAVVACIPLCSNCAGRFRKPYKVLSYEEGRQKLWKAFRARMVSKVHDE